MSHPIISWDGLHLSTGRLFIGFASLETTLSAAVRFNLSWRHDISRIGGSSGYAAVVLGSQRFKASVDTIKRIIKHEKALSSEQLEALQIVFDHGGHIAALRDKLAHQSTIPHPDEKGQWLISDTFSTRDSGDVKTWQISEGEITSAALDLANAVGWLGCYHRSGTLFKHAPEQPPAWRYKSSSLNRLMRKRADALRERLRQQQSSWQ